MLISRLMLSAMIFASGIVMLAEPQPVLAQKDATSKSRGDHSVPFWSSKASSRRLYSARNYARDFQGYLAENPKPAPQVVKEVTVAIGQNLEEAKTHLAAMKKDFAADAGAITAIEGIEKKLVLAHEHHLKLCECCENENFEVIKTMECCNDLASELDTIIAEHDALMLKLARKPGVPTAKR